MINSKVRCCHAGYKYDSVIGECVFEYGKRKSDVILRQDAATRKNIYIRVRLSTKL